MTPYDRQRAASWRAQAIKRPPLLAYALCFTIPLALAFGLSLAASSAQCTSNPQAILRLL